MGLKSQGKAGSKRLCMQNIYLGVRADDHRGWERPTAAFTPRSSTAAKMQLYSFIFNEALQAEGVETSATFWRLVFSPLHTAAASHVLWQFNLNTKTGNATTLRHTVSPIILIKSRSPTAQLLHSDVGFCSSAGFGININTLPKADTSVRKISLP